MLNGVAIKGKVNDRGIASLAYNVKLRPGVTIGLGVSLDTQNLNEAAHKVFIASRSLEEVAADLHQVGTSFEFEG